MYAGLNTLTTLNYRQIVKNSDPIGHSRKTQRREVEIESLKAKPAVSMHTFQLNMPAPPVILRVPRNRDGIFTAFAGGAHETKGSTRKKT